MVSAVKHGKKCDRENMMLCLGGHLQETGQWSGIGKYSYRSLGLVAKIYYLSFEYEHLSYWNESIEVAWLDTSLQD